VCEKCISKFKRFARKPRYKKTTPKWINYNDFCPVFSSRYAGLSMDHIIPLSHEKVCGLNVPWNIQLLTIEENNLKGNNFDGTNNNDSWRSHGI
jgi:5-methylcytosine-specific restriction endonuclease McrA